MNRGFSNTILTPNEKFGVAHEQLTAPKESKNEQIKIRTMLICFFDSQGVVHKEFVPPGQTVNKHHYREVLERLRKWFIVSGQRLRPIGCCITTKLPVTLPFPWTNFWPKKVFQWFRSHHTPLIRVRVTFSFSQNSNSTSKVVILELWTTSKRSWQTSWGHCYREWEQRLRRCVASQGNYFEGDNVDL